MWKAARGSERYLVGGAEPSSVRPEAQIVVPLEVGVAAHGVCLACTLAHVSNTEVFQKGYGQCYRVHSFLRAYAGTSGR